MALPLLLAVVEVHPVVVPHTTPVSVAPVAVHETTARQPLLELPVRETQDPRVTQPLAMPTTPAAAAEVHLPLRSQSRPVLAVPVVPES